MEEKLARNYCSSCHSFPDPSLLDKTTWQKNVLPAMAKLMHVVHPGNNPFEDADHSIRRDSSSMISDEDWRKIVSWYVQQAPDSMPSQQRPAISSYTNRFDVQYPPRTGTPAANTLVRIDPGNTWIYAANRTDSSLSVYDHQLNLEKKFSLHSIVVDLFFEQQLMKPGVRNGILTNIGIMDPNDFRTGSVQNFSISAEGMLQVSHPLLSELQRPVQTIKADLDQDGRQDYLICGFGNKEGSFYWMQDKRNGSFVQHMLSPLPGAIKTYVVDVNNDGMMDIMTLFAQAQEAIYCFVNKGAGNFERKMLISFPPVYGSSYFEMKDMNNDGYADILYTCGDNADYSYKALKDYHGIYIFLNNHDFTFTQQYFFPMHGAYKAMASDFDQDGDLDIAAISFFPDRKKQPQESFVYLENEGKMNFTPSTIKAYNEGHWITMDVGDVDGDGDEDIVAGSLYLPHETSPHEEAYQNKPFFILLRNKTVK